MSIAIEPGIESGPPARRRPPQAHNAAHIGTVPHQSCRPRGALSPEDVLRHYLSRVDPEVAASFTEPQREAIKAMLGARGVTKHAVEIRHSIPFGKRQFYTVLLMGREQRSLLRRGRAGTAVKPLNFLVYACLAALVCAPILGAVLARSL